MVGELHETSCLMQLGFLILSDCGVLAQIGSVQVIPLTEVEPAD